MLFIVCLFVSACPELAQIKNGSICTSQDETTLSVTYGCNVGYTLVGQSRRSCNTEVYEWSGKEPRCGMKRQATWLARYVIIWLVTLSLFYGIVNVKNDLAKNNICAEFLGVTIFANMFSFLFY